MSESCEPQWLNEQLNDGSRLLFLDCRTQSDYNASHITGAIHVAIPTLMLKRLKKGHISVSSVISGNESRDMFERHCKTDTIVVYDQCTQDTTDESGGGVVTLLVRKLAEDGCRVSLLQGGLVLVLNPSYWFGGCCCIGGSSAMPQSGPNVLMSKPGLVLPHYAYSFSLPDNMAATLCPAA